MLSEAPVVELYKMLNIIRIFDTPNTCGNKLYFTIREQRRKSETQKGLRTVKLVKGLPIERQHLNNRLLLSLAELILKAVLLSLVNKQVRHSSDNQFKCILFIIIIVILYIRGSLRTSFQLLLLLLAYGLVNLKVIQNISILQQLREVLVAYNYVGIAQVVVFKEIELLLNNGTADYIVVLKLAPDLIIISVFRAKVQHL